MVLSLALYSDWRINPPDDEVYILIFESMIYVNIETRCKHEFITMIDYGSIINS